MNKLSELQLDNVHKLKAENEHLKDLIDELYDMSCLEDMINDFRNGEDDEVLLSYLLLKSRVMDALKKEEKPKTVEEKPKTVEEKTEEALGPLWEEAALKFNGSKTSKHYVENK